MSAVRVRRIVRRFTMVAVIASTLPGWYVGAWVTVSRAAVSGIISRRTAEKARPVFAPLIRFSRSELPGAQFVNWTWTTTNPAQRWDAGGFHGYIEPPLSPKSGRGIETF